MYYKNSIAVLKLNKIDRNLYLFAVLEGDVKAYEKTKNCNEIFREDRNSTTFMCNMALFI